MLTRALTWKEKTSEMDLDHKDIVLDQDTEPDHKPRLQNKGLNLDLKENSLDMNRHLKDESLDCGV